MVDMKPQDPESSAFKSKPGWKRIVNAIGYSWDGLRHASVHEAAFRQELVLVVCGCVLALVLPLPLLHKLALVVVLVWVLIVELLNSAIEAVVDRVSLERHPLSKSAKDFGSAAVFLSVCMAALVWGVVLYQRFG